LQSPTKERYLKLLRRQEELLREYREILASDEDDHGFLDLTLFPMGRERTIVIERTCALANEPEKYMEMLSLPGQRASGLREIRDFTSEAESLIIVDPYIFSGQTAQADEITRDFKKSIRAAGKYIKRVHFVYDQSPSNTTNAVKKSIKQMLKDESINVTESQSDVLHDRVWISDRKSAIVVGTSLNGIGGRLAFILPLPRADLSALLDYLDDQGLSRA